MGNDTTPRMSTTANVVPLEDILLSVIIPCYNEEHTINQIVEIVRSIPVRTEIICVNDHSTDETGARLQELHASEHIDQLASHPVNKGKGAAIRTGLSMVTGDIVVVQDADLEYNPEEIPGLLQPILDGKADAVYGSRFRGGRPGRVLFFWHSVGNGLLTLLSNMLTNITLTDMETCYKVIRTDLVRLFSLKSNRFGFEPEITARLAKSGARIYEIGISYSGRTYAEGKKINWKDGVAALWHLIRFNLGSREAVGVATQLPEFAEAVAQRKRQLSEQVALANTTDLVRSDG